MPKVEDYLDLKGASAIVGLAPRTVRKLVSDGTIPAYRVGGRARGRLRFRVTELEAYIEACRVQGEAPVKQPPARWGFRSDRWKFRHV
jgi:excisionase family DNA binding protein